MWTEPGLTKDNKEWNWAKKQAYIYIITWIFITVPHNSYHQFFYPTRAHTLYSDARNMARDVQNTLIKVVEEHGGMDNTAATEYVKKLQKRGRYIQDVWSWLKLKCIYNYIY